MKKAGLFLGVVAMCGVMCAQGVKVGTGCSEAKNAKEAGAEAAARAKAAWGEGTPKIVIVFAARSLVKQELVDGVAQYFDKALIYGCEGYSPVTTVGNFAELGHTIPHGVVVLALGGEVSMTVASEPVVAGSDKKAAFSSNGEKLGVALKSAVEAAKQSRLVISFGNQHVGDNQPFMDGFYKGTGVVLPVVGAAAGGQGSKEIVKGEIVTGVNVAILLAGNFKLGVGLAGGNDKLAAKATDAFTSATKEHGSKPIVAFVFDCGGRRGNMFKQKELADEFLFMKKMVPEASIFGFYGGGEIGTVALDQPSKGVGFHIAVATIY
ncbi:MAG: FIST N-terminal domain-containing protein [bacterium]